MKKSFIFLLCVFVAGCESSSKSADADNKAHWHGSMWGLAQSLTHVMPVITTPNYKPTPQEKSTLEKAIADMEKYSQNLTAKDMVVPSQDPSLKFVAKSFASEMSNIRDNQKNWNFSQKQASLKNVSRHCVACHTRSFSASTPFPLVEGKALNNMGAYTKGNYYLAVRQFGKAIVEYEIALKNKNWANRNPELWNEAVLKMLATTVRVHNNANLTLELISSLFDKSSYPKGLEKAARQWRLDAKAWNKQQSQKQNLTMVSSLLKQADQKEKAVKHGGLLLNLRAMAGLDSYLKKGGMKARSEQAVLYYSGVISQRLESMNFHNFPQSYFQACVEIDANSKIGKKCKAQIN